LNSEAAANADKDRLEVVAAAQAQEEKLASDATATTKAEEARFVAEAAAKADQGRLEAMAAAKAEEEGLVTEAAENAANWDIIQAQAPREIWGELCLETGKCNMKTGPNIISALLTAASRKERGWGR